MQAKPQSVQEYLNTVSAERQAIFDKLRQTILGNIPKGFEECLNYGMIGYVVPHKLYPAGYHVKPELPLPFCSIASQKNFIALYHSGIYADAELQNWFEKEYAKTCKYKLDMGKSCIRFKKMDDIPFELVAELMQKISVDQWVAIYESAVNRK